MLRAVLATVLMATLASGASVTIMNGTRGWVLKEVYIRPVGSAEAWGDNLLGDQGFIGLGAIWSHETAPGVYDIRVVDTDGDGYIRLAIPVESSFRWKVTLPDMNDPADLVNPAYNWGG